MRLALSTAAAADLALDEIFAACERRGLAGIELVNGDAHGVGPALASAEVEAIRDRAEAAGAPIVAFRTGWSAAVRPEAARLSSVLGAPVVAGGESPEPEPGWVPEDVLLAAATVYARAGGTLLIAHGTDSMAVRRLRRVIGRAPAGALGMAWEVDPSAGDFPAHSPAVLAAAGNHLRHIRLRGGGPEAVEQEGRGVGALMARLALAGYDGALALAPSTPRYRMVWRAWLGRGGGWGCGSKTGDASLVRLNGEG